MSRRRVHLPPERFEAGRAALTPEARHYLADVLRLPSGAEVEVFDGRGAAFEARIDAAYEALVLGPRREAAGAGEAIAGRFDLLVANILANTLVELAPAIAARVAPAGRVLLAGILTPQEDEVRAAYVAEGLRPVPGGDVRQGEWSLLALERPAP